MKDVITLEDLGIQSPASFIASELGEKEVECPKCGIKGTQEQVDNHDCPYAFGE